jgi:hypothetical protein
MTSNHQLVLGGVDMRYVEMDQQVVKPDRSDRITQRFEGHRVVPHGELQLFERDVGRVDEGARGSRLHDLAHCDRASLGVVQERSEEQIISRLLELENDEQAERRVRLRGEKYLSLVHDPDDGRSYVFRHGTDETEGAELPADTEFYEYPSADVAQRAFEQMVEESRRAGQVVEEDSTDDLGDFESSGAEIRDLYADVDEDELTQDPVISEEEEP